MLELLKRFEDENDTETSELAEGDSDDSDEEDSLAHRLAHVDLSKRAPTASVLHDCLYTPFIRRSIIRRYMGLSHVCRTRQVSQDPE